ncbi:hypothetical protein EDD21DRAFT_406654 [Dissophora ornata]|nr:hypothetical protein EDD21DRAFT_406654 [Dissophora ornata]
MPLKPGTPTDTDLVQDASDRSRSSEYYPAESSLSSSSRNLQSCLSTPFSPRRAASSTSDRRVHFPDNPTTEITYYYIDPSERRDKRYKSSHMTDYDPAESSEDDVRLLDAVVLSTSDDGTDSDDGYGVTQQQQLSHSNLSTPSLVLPSLPTTPTPTSWSADDKASSSSITGAQGLDDPSTSKDLMYDKQYIIGQHPPIAQERPPFKPGHRRSRISVSDFPVSPETYFLPSDNRVSLHSSSSTSDSVTKTRSSSASTPVSSSNSSAKSSGRADAGRTFSARQQEKQPARDYYSTSQPKSPHTFETFTFRSVVNLQLATPTPTLCTFTGGNLAAKESSPTNASNASNATNASNASISASDKVAVAIHAYSSNFETCVYPGFKTTHTHPLHSQRHFLTTPSPLELSSHIITHSDEFLEAVLAASGDVPVNLASLSTTLPSTPLATEPLGAAASSSHIVRNDLHAGIVEIYEIMVIEDDKDPESGSRVDESPPTRRSFRQRLKDKLSIFKSKKKTTKVDGGR